MARTYKRDKRGRFASSKGFGGGLTRALSRGVKAVGRPDAVKPLTRTDKIVFGAVVGSYAARKIIR